MTFNLFKYIILISLIVIVGAVFYIFNSGNRGVDLVLQAPEEVLIGVPFDLRVEFSNQSGGVLKNVSLTVNLPEGAVFLGSSEDKLRESKNLGDVGEGSLTSETYKVVFLKGRDTEQKFRATVAFSPTKIGARFENHKDWEVKVRESGVSIAIAGPETVFSGEEFDLDVVYRNVSEVDFSNLELKLEYPPNFSFISSTIKSDKGKDTWLLGDLRKGSEGHFTVRGSLVGPDNAISDFRSNLKTSLDGRAYDLEIKPFSLSIAPSPLALVVMVNDKPDYVARPNENLTYLISYVNSTNTALRDVVIRAQLIGDLFDFSSLSTDANFRASDNTLIWNSQNMPALNNLAPNSAGFVRFSVKTKSNYPIQRFGDKNFILRVNAEIESPTASGSNTSKTFSLIRLDTKVAGNLVLDTRAFFRDAGAGILNQGPLPPRVSQETSFTIHWLLKNFAADISNLEVRASLPEGVKFNGVAKSNFGSAPFYDEPNKQIVWQINKLLANKGVMDQSPEAIFQVTVTPITNYIGSYMPILGETTAKGMDDFLGVETRIVAPLLTTSLPDDVTVGSQGGVVQP